MPPSSRELAQGLGVVLDGYGFAVKPTFAPVETSRPGVYACGDIQRGASLVVWAIRDGREAADAMLDYLAANAAVAAE